MVPFQAECMVRRLSLLGVCAQANKWAGYSEVSLPLLSASLLACEFTIYNLGIEPILLTGEKLEERLCFNLLNIAVVRM
jgi:hypothetical protein